MHLRVAQGLGKGRRRRVIRKSPHPSTGTGGGETGWCGRRGLGLVVCKRQQNRLFLILACGALAFAYGCKKPTGTPSKATLEYEISPRPFRIGPATIVLRLKDAGGKPIPGARITLEADMSHAGMNPVFGEAKEIGAGQYEGNLEFAMAGDWAILVHVTLADGQKFDRQMNVPGVRAN
jgi:YtkA-like